MVVVIEAPSIYGRSSLKDMTSRCLLIVASIISAGAIFTNGFMFVFRAFYGNIFQLSLIGSIALSLMAMLIPNRGFRFVSRGRLTSRSRCVASD